MGRLRRRAGDFLRDLGTLYFICRDPEMPGYAKTAAIGIVLYAVSPLDLLPDAIPALGVLDDLIVVPAGLFLVSKLIPTTALAEHRRRADRLLARLSWWAIALGIAAIWAVATILVAVNLQ